LFAVFDLNGNAVSSFKYSNLSYRGNIQISYQPSIEDYPWAFTKINGNQGYVDKNGKEYGFFGNMLKKLGI